MISLAETGCYNPSINELRFPNTPTGPISTSTGRYWTSTGAATQVSLASVVVFNDGDTSYNNKLDLIGVRLVRGGQEPALPN